MIQKCEFYNNNFQSFSEIKTEIIESLTYPPKNKFLYFILFIQPLFNRAGPIEIDSIFFFKGVSSKTTLIFRMKHKANQNTIHKH